MPLTSTYPRFFGAGQVGFAPPVHLDSIWRPSFQCQKVEKPAWTVAQIAASPFARQISDFGQYSSAPLDRRWRCGRGCSSKPPGPN